MKEEKNIPFTIDLLREVSTNGYTGWNREQFYLLNCQPNTSIKKVLNKNKFISINTLSLLRKLRGKVGYVVITEKRLKSFLINGTLNDDQIKLLSIDNWFKAGLESHLIGLIVHKHKLKQLKKLKNQGLKQIINNTRKNNLLQKQEDFLRNLHKIIKENPQETIKILKRTAEKVKYEIKIPYSQRQAEFENKKKNIYRFLTNEKCFCCKKNANSRHHIIQLQYGGLNIEDNIIPICDDCHEKIHPWMKKYRQKYSENNP